MALPHFSLTPVCSPELCPPIAGCWAAVPILIDRDLNPRTPHDFQRREPMVRRQAGMAAGPRNTPRCAARQLEPKEKRPMTVRWKPLLILSGLFFVVAVIGVVAMVWTMGPRSAQGVLNQARAAAAEGRFENAEIYFKQALQIDPKNPAIHVEFANLYRDWGKTAPAEKRETIQTERTAQLVAAAKFDKSGRGPRVQLLEISMAQDIAADAVYWAREVLKVDADNPDAHYVLALDELESRIPEHPRGQAAPEGARRARGSALPPGLDRGHAGPVNRRRQGAG